MGFVMVPYMIGIFVSIYVYMGRAGLYRSGVNRLEFLLPNLGWHLMQVPKGFLWPAVLVTWLAQGCPASRWKAVTEVRGNPARAVVRR
jgi:hypothetical protein